MDELYFSRQLMRRNVMVNNELRGNCRKITIFCAAKQYCPFSVFVFVVVTFRTCTLFTIFMLWLHLVQFHLKFHKPAFIAGIPTNDNFSNNMLSEWQTPLTNGFKLVK